MICLATGFEARSDVRTAVRTARAGLEPEERDGATRGGMANPTIGSTKPPRPVSDTLRFPTDDFSRFRGFLFYKKGNHPAFLQRGFCNTKARHWLKKIPPDGGCVAGKFKKKRAVLFFQVFPRVLHLLLLENSSPQV